MRDTAVAAPNILSHRDGRREAEVYGGHLEVGREVLVGPVEAVGVAKVFGVPAHLGTPEPLGDGAEAHVVDLGDANEAAEPAPQVVDLDEVADAPVPGVELAVGQVVSVGLACRRHLLAAQDLDDTLVVEMGAPELHPFE